STCPEVVAAAHCGMAVLGLSLITNRCLGPDDDLPAPSHEEVLQATEARARDMESLVKAAVARMDLAALPVNVTAAAFAAAAPRKGGRGRGS
ncbi:hypothetical protein U2087_15560, partial [Listeria monocytogenes]